MSAGEWYREADLKRFSSCIKLLGYLSKSFLPFPWGAVLSQTKLPAVVRAAKSGTWAL